MKMKHLKIAVAILALAAATPALADDSNPPVSFKQPQCVIPYQRNQIDCWLAVSNIADCYVWNDQAYDQHQVTSFAGECRNGKLNGEGVQIVQTTAYGQTVVWTNRGRYTDGKRSNRWTLRRGDGGIYRGHYVGGKRNGVWVYYAPRGGEHRSCYRLGKRIEC